MRFGLVISILLHAIVIAFAVISFNSSMPLLDMPEQVPVEVVTIDEAVNVKAVTPEKAEEEKAEPAPQPTPPTATPPPPEPEPAPPAPTMAEVTPPPEPKAEEQPKPERPIEVRPQPRPTPPKQAEKPKDEFNLDNIAVLINKAQRKEEQQQKTAEAKPSDTTGEKARAAQGAGTDMTMTLVQSMQRQVEQCWSFPAGAVQPEDLSVYITINLKPDGSLAEPPQIENQSRMGEPYFRTAAEAAVRALFQCQPYDLPADQYDVWKEIRLNFDPRRMIGL